MPTPFEKGSSKDVTGGLAARMKEVRRFRGRTQEAVAEALKVNYRHLQKIEGGRSDFKLSTLGRLASLYEVEPCFLTNTAAAELFRSVALPCQSLMLDALSVGVLLVDGKGGVGFRNRRASELLERAKMLSPDGATQSGLLESLQRQAAQLSDPASARKWREDLRGPDGSGFSLEIEARLHPSRPGSRQLLYLLDSDLPFEAQPVRLARSSEASFLATPAVNVRCYRQSRKLTQSQAAESLGMNLRYYQKIESGKLDLKCSTLAKMAKTFAVEPCRLLVDENLRPSCVGSYPCAADLLDQLPYGVVALGPRGELAYANDAYFHLLGLSYDPARHKHFWDLLPSQEEVQRAQSFLQAIFRDRPPPVPYRREITRADGTKASLINCWNYLLAEGNRLLGGIGIVREDVR